MEIPSSILNSLERAADRTPSPRTKFLLAFISDHVVKMLFKCSRAFTYLLEENVSDSQDLVPGARQKKTTKCIAQCASQASIAQRRPTVSRAYSESCHVDPPT